MRKLLVKTNIPKEYVKKKATKPQIRWSYSGANSTQKMMLKKKLPRMAQKIDWGCAKIDQKFDSFLTGMGISCKVLDHQKNQTPYLNISAVKQDFGLRRSVKPLLKVIP